LRRRPAAQAASSLRRSLRIWPRIPHPA
jgi:hypothetical protein